MITAVSLVNICHRPSFKKTFVCGVRTFKISSLSGFQMYNTVLLTRVTGLSIYNPRMVLFIYVFILGLLYFFHWEFVPFDSFRPCCPLPTPPPLLAGTQTMSFLASFQAR